MITFNALLRNEGIDPRGVKLVRHQDTRVSYDEPTPYQLWRSADGRLDLYQRIQFRPVFKNAHLIASFVATPLNETLFVGLYHVKAVEKAPIGLADPISGKDVHGHYFYTLELEQSLCEYRGRLLIDWGKGFRAWVQLAAKKDKSVMEIRRTAFDPPFPGLLKFRETFSSLSTVPTSWRQTLSAVGGIYLLTHPSTGKHYVGSAGGTSGFWGRWEDYIVSGHGGNRRMMDVPAADYQVTILEVASSSTGINDLIEMETVWKKKLLTRDLGLNAN